MGSGYLFLPPAVPMSAVIVTVKCARPTLWEGLDKRPSDTGSSSAGGESGLVKVVGKLSSQGHDSL